jgi:hypothetical protein
MLKKLERLERLERLEPVRPVNGLNVWNYSNAQAAAIDPLEFLGVREAAFDRPGKSMRRIIRRAYLERQPDRSRFWKIRSL